MPLPKFTRKLQRKFSQCGHILGSFTHEIQTLNEEQKEPIGDMRQNY